ncbi:MAG: hypothetical protein FWH29_09285 [Methanobrevibacter sp.]|nr:hypothetical protein [Methanobrevibacter sp.]
MSNVVEFVTFKLKKGASEPDFLLVSDKFNHEFLAKQKGYISRNLLVDGEIWADLVFWETMEDAKNAVKAFRKSEAAKEYMSFLNGPSCKLLHLSVKKSY